MILLSSDFAGGFALGTITGIAIVVVILLILVANWITGLKYPEEKEPIDWDGFSGFIPPQNKFTNQ